MKEEVKYDDPFVKEEVKYDPLSEGEESVNVDPLSVGDENLNSTKDNLKDNGNKTDKLIQCKICFYVAVTPLELAEHFRQIHGLYYIGKRRCPYCSKVFSSSTILKRHVERVVCGSSMLRCSKCSYRSRSAIELDKHHLMKHLVFKQVQPKP